MLYSGKSYSNALFGGTPILGNLHIIPQPAWAVTACLESKYAKPLTGAQSLTAATRLLG